MLKKKTILKWTKIVSDFTNHLTLFVIVNAVMWLVWLMMDSGNFLSPLLYISVTWSVILGLHYLFAGNKIKQDNNINP